MQSHSRDATVMPRQRGVAARCRYSCYKMKMPVCFYPNNVSRKYCTKTVQTHTDVCCICKESLFRIFRYEAS